MSDAEWDKWVDFYAGCFGFSSDADVAMFLAWRQVFEEAGYTIEELNLAGREIAMHPPRTEYQSAAGLRTEHLARIHHIIDRRRYKEKMRQELVRMQHVDEEESVPLSEVAKAMKIGRRETKNG